MRLAGHAQQERQPLSLALAGENRDARILKDQSKLVI
jgi:hypothetical protein